jgi:hypothetical protein
MVGFQLEGMFQNKTKKLNKVEIDGIIINNTVFYAIQKNLLVALEVLTFFDFFTGESSVAFYPQVHIKFSTNFELQVGVGLVFSKDKILPQFVHRTIFASPPPTQSA